MPALEDLTARQQRMFYVFKQKDLLTAAQFVRKNYSQMQVAKDIKALADLGLIERYNKRSWVFVRTYDENGMRADR